MFDPDKTNLIGFTIDKIQRLVQPLIVCVFVFLIPRLYITQEFENIGRVKGPEGPEIEWDLVKYVPKILSSDIIMKFG